MSDSPASLPGTLYGSIRIDRQALEAEAKRLGLTGQQLGALLLARCIVRGDPSPGAQEDFLRSTARQKEDPGSY